MREMRGFFKKVRGKSFKPEGGFTLIELLVVIGIIVALAAITIPLVTRFTETGKEGALEAERQTVQTAMNAMMAEQNITTVDANETIAAVRDFTAMPTEPSGVPAAADVYLAPYLKQTSTTYLFCWKANGEIYGRNGAANTPGSVAFAETETATGNCFAPP